MKKYFANPKNRKKQSANLLNYYRNHPEKQGVIVYRNKLFNILGKNCIKCGFDDKRALQIDEIKGGGTKLSKKMGGKYHVYRLYVKNPKKAKKDLQILCANCNWIKRYKNKETRRKN